LPELDTFGTTNIEEQLGHFPRNPIFDRSTLSSFPHWRHWNSITVFYLRLWPTSS